MKRFIIVISGVFFALALAGRGYADSGRFAVARKVGTLGAGVEVTTRIIPNLNARLGANAFDYDYRGIGWDNAVGKNGRWGFVVDLGVVFQGSPHGNLTADGKLAEVPAFQADLAWERQELADGLEDFRYWPVFALGVSFKF